MPLPSPLINSTACFPPCFCIANVFKNIFFSYMKQHLTNTCIVSPRQLQEKKVDMEASIYPLAVWRPRANRESDNNLHSGNTAGFFWRFPSCMKPRIAQSLLVVTCAFQGTIWRTLETMDDMTSSDLWDAPSCWEGILLNWNKMRSAFLKGICVLNLVQVFPSYSQI